MHPIDFAIVAAYLVGLIVIGFLLARRARQSSDSYFLGNRTLPWWALGASGMSSNLDVAGTTAIIALLYHYGLHGFFIEFRGGVVLPIAVWLAFMGKWHRRSKVTTTGEWMLLRFGDGAGGLLARLTAAGTYLVITIGMVLFFLSAAGGFMAEFWPGTPTTREIAAVQAEIDEQVKVVGEPVIMQVADDGSAFIEDEAAPLTLPAARYELGDRVLELEAMKQHQRSTEQWLAVAMALLALLYTAAAGLHGVVWTDVFQAFIIGAAAIYAGVAGFMLISPELLTAWPGAEFNTAYPQLYNEGLNKSGVADGLGDYAIFGMFLLFFAGKGLLEGLGGSGGSGYMAQRFYAAPSDADTRKIAMLWALLFSFRWPLVLGLTIIAVHLGSGAEATDVLLPTVLKDYFPVGVRGLMIAALFAASMSTFDSTINAGASYVVRDFFKPLRPYASAKAEVIVGYLASAGIVAVGLGLTLLTNLDVLVIWQQIVLLFAAFLVPFALRWYWPRLTGLGFAGGCLFGFLAKLVGAPAILSLLGYDGTINEAGEFFTTASVSFVACIVITYLSQPVDESVLLRFYRQMRPVGLWPLAWRKRDAVEHRNDGLRLLVAVVWQVLTFLLPMTAVLHMWTSFIAIAIPWAALTIVLWRDTRQSATDDAVA